MIPTARPLSRRVLAAVAVAVALLLAACTGGDGDGGGADDTAALQDRLTTARATIDDAETVEVSISASEVPDGVSGLLSAQGTGNHSPAFQGDVKVSTGGATLTAEVVAVEGTVYAKTDITPTFLTIDPASLRAPDPAMMAAGLSGVVNA